MKKLLAEAIDQSSNTENKFSMYIGRWQPWHAGHRWLIDQSLNEGKKVLLCIRDVETCGRNPWTAEEVKSNLETHLSDLINDGKIKLMIIPDIESVNIGRGIGYHVIEHVPPDEIKEISGTKIRQEMKVF
jgi:nicotinamide mononucleotide adenylyltransferase